METPESTGGEVRLERQVRREGDLFEQLLPEGVSSEWLEGYRKEVIALEHQHIIDALVGFLNNGGGTFRKWLEFLGMDYHPAYLEGWMGFTNALCDHESRILGKEPEPMV